MNENDKYSMKLQITKTVKLQYTHFQSKQMDKLSYSDNEIIVDGMILHLKREESGKYLFRVSTINVNFECEHFERVCNHIPKRQSLSIFIAKWPNEELNKLEICVIPGIASDFCTISLNKLDLNQKSEIYHQHFSFNQVELVNVLIC